MKKRWIILFTAAVLQPFAGSVLVSWAGPLEDVVHGESRMKGEEPWTYQVQKETPPEEQNLEEISSPEGLDLLRARIETGQTGEQGVTGSES